MGNIKRMVWVNVAYYIILSIFLVLFVLNPSHFVERYFVMVVSIGIALILLGLFLLKMVISDFPLLMRLGLFCLMPIVGGLIFLWFVVVRYMLRNPLF